MNEASIAQYITNTFEKVNAVSALGHTFFFYNPDRDQPDEIYFATLKTKDDEYDSVSDLNRPSVYRLNLGLSKEGYGALFGARPSRHRATTAEEPRHDYTALDQLLPHPVYAHLYWVCILNPSETTFQAAQPLIADAYALAVSKYAKRAVQT